MWMWIGTGLNNIQISDYKLILLIYLVNKYFNLSDNPEIVWTHSYSSIKLV